MYESPFHAIDIPVASTSAGTSTHAGEPASTATAASVTATATPMTRSGRTREPSRSGPASDADPQRSSESLSDCEDRGRLAGREAVLVVQEEDDEAHHRHLGDKVEPAPPAGEPEPPVAQRQLDVDLLDVLLRARSQTSAPASAPTSTSRRRRGARRVVSRARAARARHRAADRHGRLADAEREVSLVRREPASDRSAAARLDAAARDPGEPEQDHEPAEARRERRGGQEGGAQAEPGGKVQRSPKRSTAKPHGSSANVSSIHSAASTTPISVRLSPYSSRSAGASTATANATVENDACAVARRPELPSGSSGLPPCGGPSTRCDRRCEVTQGADIAEAMSATEDAVLAPSGAARRHGPSSRRQP